MRWESDRVIFLPPVCAARRAFNLSVAITRHFHDHWSRKETIGKDRLNYMKVEVCDRIMMKCLLVLLLVTGSKLLTGNLLLSQIE